MELESVRGLIEYFGSNRKAADALKNETGYAMSHSTIGRVANGEAKPAMIAFVRYALTNAKAKLESED